MQISGGLVIGSGITVNSGDPYFNYVSMLTSAAGGNTATANTFIDSGPNSLSITRTGNVAQGTFSPYGQSWSNYFDGNGSYLQTPTSSSLAANSANYTVEGWFYYQGTYSAYDLGGRGIVTDFLTNSSGRWFVYITSAGYLAFSEQDASGLNNITVTDSTLMQTNTWVHFAAVKSGTTMQLFKNGVSVGTATSAVRTTFGGRINIGQLTPDVNYRSYWVGYISDIRLTIGTARYSGSFTPPSSPSLAISGCQLLTCQSNRFIDNSVNNFSLTDTGNVLATDISPYVPNNGILYGPYGDVWSNVFDGNADYLGLTGKSLSGTQLTIEGWVYFNSVANGPYLFSFGQGNTGGISTNRYGVYVDTANSRLSVVSVTSNTLRLVTSDPTAQVTTGTWYHFAFVFDGADRKLYVNGILVVTDTFPIPPNGTNWAVGGYQFSGGGALSVNGYMSNFRVTNKALYSRNFTPPTSPLTPIEGTILLTCQSNSLVDESPNAYAITKVGEVTPTTAVVPFVLNNAYLSTLNGGSGYFNGTTDYLSTVSSSAFAFGADDYTIECWAYFTSNAKLQFFGSSDNTNYWAMGLNANNQMTFRPITGTSNEIVGTSTINANTWNHFAAVREGTGTDQTKIYVNGLLEKTGNVSTNYSSPNILQLGTDRTALTNLFTGYISDFRVSNTSVYTANFSTPSAPLTITANTAALINATNAGIYDISGKNNLITYGNTQVSNVVTKFGSGSIYFPGGATDYLQAPYSNSLVLSTGSFTVEFWMYCTNTTGVQHIAQFGFVPAFTGGWVIYSDTGTIYWAYSSGGGATTTVVSYSSLSANTWYHIAFAKTGGLLELFVDGQQVTSSSDGNDYSPGTGAAFTLSSSSNRFNGYIEQFRITRGIARYTDNFSAPAGPFPPC